MQSGSEYPAVPCFASPMQSLFAFIPNISGFLFSPATEKALLPHSSLPFGRCGLWLGTCISGNYLQAVVKIDEAF